MDITSFLDSLEKNVDDSRLKKSYKMLKADRFQLFVRQDNEQLVGVVKSQSNPDLVYSCRLGHDGSFACCTQNLNPCGGLRGALCKHLLVLIIGMANSGDLDLKESLAAVKASRKTKPLLDKEAMGTILLEYKGAEAGEVDWRPTETIPEDYYAY